MCQIYRLHFPSGCVLQKYNVTLHTQTDSIILQWFVRQLPYYRKWKFIIPCYIDSSYAWRCFCCYRKQFLPQWLTQRRLHHSPPSHLWRISMWKKHWNKISHTWDWDSSPRDLSWNLAKKIFGLSVIIFNQRSGPPGTTTHNTALC